MFHEIHLVVPARRLVMFCRLQVLPGLEGFQGCRFFAGCLNLAMACSVKILVPYFTHRLLRYPFYTTPIPKEGPNQAWLYFRMGVV